MAWHYVWCYGVVRWRSGARTEGFAAVAAVAAAAANVDFMVFSGGEAVAGTEGFAAFAAVAAAAASAEAMTLPLSSGRRGPSTSRNSALGDAISLHDSGGVGAQEML